MISSTQAGAILINKSYFVKPAGDGHIYSKKPRPLVLIEADIKFKGSTCLQPAVLFKFDIPRNSQESAATIRERDSGCVFEAAFVIREERVPVRVLMKKRSTRS